MDRLTIMRSFVGVTKSRSFSQAARSLGISGSLVSRHVAELERSLGVRLVNRTARTISLTNAGNQYAEFATRIIDEIDHEDAHLRGLRDKPEGSLAVISPKWIGSNDVGDAIVAFSTRYPKIHIRFEVGGMSERSYEFLDQGFDVAFHTRHVRDCNLMLRKISDLEFALCAAPGYIRRAGEPADVAELNDHDCLANTNDPIWHLQYAGHDVHLKVNEPVYSSNSYVTLRKAALAGLGISVLPIRLVEDELASGELVNVIEGCEVPNRPLYALHSPGGQIPVRVQLFLDFVTDWFRKQAATPNLQLKASHPAGWAVLSCAHDRNACGAGDIRGHRRRRMHPVLRGLRARTGRQGTFRHPDGPGTRAARCQRPEPPAGRRGRLHVAGGRLGRRHPGVTRGPGREAGRRPRGHQGRR
jgi:DNA-binding transcriptional LysR family regulator